MYVISKLKVENDLKDGFYSVGCRNPRERRVIEFLLPILYPGKPKQLSITMANMIFGALFRARLVKWGRFIQKLVKKLIPHIGKKPSPLSPYMHLYRHNGCVNKAEGDALMFAEDEVGYNLTPKAEQKKVGTEGSLSDPTVLELLLAANTLDLKKTTTSRTTKGASSSHEPNWGGGLVHIWLSGGLFKHIREEIDELHNLTFGWSTSPGAWTRH